MKIESLHINMKVTHPQYGMGVVRLIGEHTAEIQFEAGLRTVSPEASELQPVEPQITVGNSEMPLGQLIEQVTRKMAQELGLEKPNTVIEELGARWNNGRVVIHPADPTLLPKEVPIEVFFHKIVMMRNNLRTLEQKINAHPKLNDGEKIEMQQYITRCYGSMTTFNMLFKTKEGQFQGTGTG